MSSGKWFDDYFDSIYSYILLQVKDLHTAEDLTQETFLKVVANEHKFKQCYQQVIILRKIQGFSTKEAASILHCSEAGKPCF